MTDARDPMALVRHAVQVCDWRLVELLAQALSGLFLPTVGQIWVNAGEAREWPGRRRFTIAHELAHWRLHRHDQEAVFCRSNSVEPAPPDTRAPLPPMEEEANAFGAAVLM